MPSRSKAMEKKPAPVPVSPGMVERLAALWSGWSPLAAVKFVWNSMALPCLLQPIRDQLQQLAGSFLRRHGRRLLGLADPYLTVTVAEYDGGQGMKRAGAYEEAKAYLSRRCARGARSLRAEGALGGGGRRRFVLSMGDGEEVVDEFRGATVWWNAVPAAAAASHRDHHGARFDAEDDGAAAAGRMYRLSFHQRHRDLVVDSYLPHVCREGRAIMNADRRRKLFTNTGERFSKSSWNHVVFKHPSTFETLAMDPAKKKDIMDDLDAFRNGKDYYERIGKAWKRGYLLYGPPGTGKSSMIAAMANYLDYHIYDIELTSVYTNTDLRRMFIDTKGKSIIVIEDIDCSLDLTGKRRHKKKGAAAAGSDAGDTNKDGDNKKEKEKAEDDKIGGSKVTLSGVLNFIDGLWSACGGERVIVFTTNHVEKLDPALIRRGRMDKHIEMSYCCFESFKFLARNYLAVDDHPLFDDVRALLREVNITPADVAELLTPKRAGDDEGSCLAALVETLREAKESAASKITDVAEPEILTPKRAGDDGGSCLAGLVETLLEAKETAAAKTADVAELWTPKRAGNDEGSCLAGLVETLREAKETSTSTAMDKTGGASCSVEDDEETVEDE